MLQSSFRIHPKGCSHKVCLKIEKERQGTHDLNRLSATLKWLQQAIHSLFI